MNSQEMLEQLEALAQRMSIKVRYEKCKSRGGLCRVKGEQMIIVRKNLTVPEKVDILSHAVCKLPLEDYYMMPEVRKVLEDTAYHLDKANDAVQDNSMDLEDELADLR
jgi:hypothetical protein